MVDPSSIDLSTIEFVECRSLSTIRLSENGNPHYHDIDIGGYIYLFIYLSWLSYGALDEACMWRKRGRRSR